MPQNTTENEGSQRPDGDLLSTAERDTIGDVVSIENVDEWLPHGWSVTVEVVEFDTGEMEEVLQFCRSGSYRDAELRLKPSELYEPTADVELYEWRSDVTSMPEPGRGPRWEGQTSPAGEWTEIGTAESLRKAFRAAKNWVRQQ
jgi:hypothetical protein